MENASTDQARRSAGILRAAMLLVGSVLLLLASLLLYALWEFDAEIHRPAGFRNYEYTAARLARGRYLFLASCASCHMDDNSTLGGKLSRAMPLAMARPWTPNLSRDPIYGNPGWTDAELWRVLRHAIGRENHRIPLPMPSYRNLREEDIASLITFLRKDDQIAAPVSEPSEISIYNIPARISTVLYHSQVQRGAAYNSARDEGAYLADEIMKCGQCHSRNVMSYDGEPRYDGSSVMWSGSQRFIEAPPLSGPGSYIARYSQAEFRTLIREGRTPDGHVVEMPVWPTLSDHDIDTVHAFFLRLNPQEPPQAPLAHLRPRNLQASQCSACHYKDRTPGTAAFQAAHTNLGGPRSLRWRVSAPLLQPD